MTRDQTTIECHWHHFSALTSSELYALLRLRQQVFVVEQQCIYVDADNLDQAAMHLLCLETTSVPQLLGCLRLLPPGGRFRHPTIGRLATASTARGRGLARRMMEMAIAYSRQHHEDKTLVLAAQCYLAPFYARLGFRPISSPYQEDGIPHVDMMLRPLPGP